jgi:hypothetical protein
MRLGNMYKPFIVCWIGSSVGRDPCSGQGGLTDQVHVYTYKHTQQGELQPFLLSVAASKSVGPPIRVSKIYL